MAISGSRGLLLRDGQVLGADLYVAGQDVAAFDQIFKLAEISREVILLQLLQCLRSRARRRGIYSSVATWL